jgi:hypothetical protein
MSKLVYIILILISFNSLASAIELFENGVISENALAGGDVNHTFNYVNPKNSSFIFDANFSIGNIATEIRLSLLNYERRTLLIGLSSNAINVYDSLNNPITTFNLPSTLTFNEAYKMSITYTPDTTASMGGLINITLYSNNTPIYTKEILGFVEYFNNLSIVGISTIQSGDGAMDAIYNITAYSLSVSKVSQNRSVVIIPL